MFLSHISECHYQFPACRILPTILFRGTRLLWYGYGYRSCRPQLVSRVRTDQDAPIYKLPPEMIQHIATFLQPSSVAVFVLSNKYFLAVLGTQFIKVEKPYKLQYLKAIQQEVPNHLLCHVCMSFHPRRRHRSGCSWLGEPTCFSESGVFSYGLRGNFTLLFPDIQQIMNHHRFGKRYGFSAQEISYTWFGKISPFSVFTRESADAIIADDKLLLRTDSRCRYSWFSNQVKMLAVYAPIRFCPHLSDKDLNLFSFSKRQKTFAKCSVCNTEVRIQITPVGGSDSEVQTTSWYTFGSCRDPYDYLPLQWMALTEQSFTRGSLKFIWERETVSRKAYSHRSLECR